MENDLEHNASLSGAVTALRQDELKRMNAVMEKTKLEEKVQRKSTIVTASFCVCVCNAGEAV